MAILKGHKAQFETLKQAFANGDIALMECQRKDTGEIVSVICAVNVTGRSKKFEYRFVPFAQLFNGNPYDLLEPPALGGGFRTEGNTPPDDVDTTDLSTDDQLPLFFE